MGVSNTPSGFGLGLGSYVQQEIDGLGNSDVYSSPMVRVNGPITVWCVNYANFVNAGVTATTVLTARPTS